MASLLTALRQPAPGGHTYFAAELFCVLFLFASIAFPQVTARLGRVPRIVQTTIGKLFAGELSARAAAKTADTVTTSDWAGNWLAGSRVD